MAGYCDIKNICSSEGRDNIKKCTEIGQRNTKFLGIVLTGLHELENIYTRAFDHANYVANGANDNAIKYTDKKIDEVKTLVSNTLNDEEYISEIEKAVKAKVVKDFEKVKADLENQINELKAQIDLLDTNSNNR